MPDIYTASGIAEGFNKTMSNLLNIYIAKDELKRERELFGIKKKQSALEMQKLEAETSPEMLDLLKRKQKVDVETAEVDLEAKEVTLEQSRKSISDVIRELQETGRSLNLPGYGGEEGAVAGDTDFTLPEGWSFETKVGGGKLKIGTKTDKEKKDYLLKIPPKEFDAKKKEFWPRLGDAMLSTLTGRNPGDVTEADRTATITEAKRKYTAGEALSSEEATILTMNSVKTKQDIEELLERREEYEEKGVDVEFILKFFTTEEEE